jgi:hypothetical protein
MPDEQKPRALMTPWERKVLRSGNARPQHKYQVKKRVGTAIGNLAFDISDLLTNRELYLFNQRHVGDWYKAMNVLRVAFEELTAPREYPLTQVFAVNKGGQDWLWADRPFTLTVSFVGGSPQPMVIGQALTSDELDKVVKLLDKPEDLKYWIATRLIKSPYTRNIVKKALVIGYHFPESEEMMVPLYVVKSWLHNKEMENVRPKHQAD